MAQATRAGRVIAVTAALALTVSSCGGNGDDDASILPDKGTVHIATVFDQPSFNLFKAHHHRGFDMDLAYYLGEELDFTPKFQDVVHGEREGEIKEDGERKRAADMVIATFSITPKREKKVDFIGPYLTTPQKFLVRADYDGIKKEKDLSDKLVCAVEGTTPADVGLPKDATLKLEPDYSSCVAKLQEGGIDAVFSDEVILFGYVQQQKKSKVPLKVVPNVTMGLINRYGIGIPEGHEEDECQRILKVMRKYLSDRWSSDFRTQLPDLVERYPDDWQNNFKPDPDDLSTYSCNKD